MSTEKSLDGTYTLRKMAVRYVFRVSLSFFRSYLTGVTVSGVRIRAAVNWAARIWRCLLGTATRQQTNDGEDDAQHQDQACYADSNRETALRYADAVVRCLEKKKS